MWLPKHTHHTTQILIEVTSRDIDLENQTEDTPKTQLSKRRKTSIK